MRRLGTDAASRAELSARITAAAPAIFENPAAVEQLERFFAHACRAAVRGAGPA